MAQINVNAVAPTRAAAGSAPLARGDFYGNLIVQQAGAQYRDVVLNGYVFHATNTSDVTIGTALTSTGVTFHLFNPSTSGKNLVIMDWTFAEATVTVTAGNAVIAINPSTVQAAPTTTTALTQRNCLVGSGIASVAAAYSAATLAAAPVAALQFASVATAVGIVSAIHYDLQGMLILSQNTIANMQGVTVSWVGRASAIWEETPV